MSNIGNTEYNNNYNKNRHSVYLLRYHLVVVTKYRHPVINGRIRERLLEITGETFRKWKCNVISAEGSLDYLHVYFSAPEGIRIGASTLLLEAFLLVTVLLPVYCIRSR